MKANQRVRRRVRLADAELGPTEPRAPQIQTLLKILDRATLFHSPDGTAYADIEVKGHRETWKVRSLRLREWLTGSFYRETARAANNDAVEQTLRIAEARAKYDGVERQVCVRVGSYHGAIYLDLADTDWRAIQIDAAGWRVVSRPRVRFVRTKGMLPLPLPVRGGRIDQLRKFINVSAGEDFILIKAWLLAAMRDTGPYPVLTINGEQGSAKSTQMEVLRSLIDPSQASLRSPPRETRDLFIAANNAHVLAFDNLSSIPPWLSDELARISTGAAFTTRKLRTDEDETIMQVVKPIILNGITDIVSRPDLSDRCIFVTAERITENDRKPKEDLLATFQLERPSILGALLDAAANGIANLPTTHGQWQRMADFAKWATACESAYTTAGSFNAAYEQNRIEAVKVMLEDDPLAGAILQLKRPWEGTATEMLDELNAKTDRAHISARGWPRDAKALSGQLSRLAPLLRKRGVSVSQLRRTSAKRGWKLVDVSEDKTDLASSSSPGSMTVVTDKVKGDANGSTEHYVTPIVTENPVIIIGNDGRDVSDDKFAGHSGQQHTTAVQSDIDAANQELRIRGEMGGQSHQPARLLRERKRIRVHG